MFSVRLIAAAALATVMTPVVAFADPLDPQAQLDLLKAQKHAVVGNIADLSKIYNKRVHNVGAAPKIGDQLSDLNGRLTNLNKSIKALKHQLGISN